MKSSPNSSYRHKRKVFIHYTVIVSIFFAGCAYVELLNEETLRELTQSELWEKYNLVSEFVEKNYQKTVLTVNDSNRLQVRQLAQENKINLIELAVLLPFFHDFFLEVVEVRNGIGYIEEDIELGKIEDLIAVDSLNRSAKISFSFGLNQSHSGIWPGGIIPFEIKTSDFTSATISRINQAVDSMNTKTNLTLIRRTTEDDYVKIEKNDDLPGGGSSPIGKCGGCVIIFHTSHVVRIGVNAPVSTIIHEFLHTAGVYHEQSRPDRDDFISINFNCIEDGKEHNFKKRDGTTYGPYDLNSRMHYRATDFQRSGSTCNTITANDGSSSIGGSALTSNDINGLVGLYNSTHGKDGTTHMLTLDKEKDAKNGFTIVDGNLRRIEPPAFPNDAIYGLRVRNFPSGAIIKVYDNKLGDTSDDWTEIIFKRDVTDLVIYNFERNSDSNPNYKTVYNTRAGSGNLNGKVSRIEIDLSPPPTTAGSSVTPTTLRPRIVLRKGNHGTGDFAGTINDAVPFKTFDFTQVNTIDSDAARSMVLFDIKAGTVIRVFDNSRGSKLDDWAEIIVAKGYKQQSN